MPVYFFDTSALVKHYHEEVGTDVVDDALSEEDAVCVITDLTIIEAHAAFAKKARQEEITKEDVRATVQKMTQEIQQKMFSVCSLGERAKRRALALLHQYGVRPGLRTLDALQLAGIEEAERQLSVPSPGHIYCADQRFAAVIEGEGWEVVDPEEEAKGREK